MLLESFADEKQFLSLAQKANVIPVGVKILADTETPVSVLARFMDQDSFFLLESVSGGERWGRYSFMGLQPKVRLSVYRDEVVVREGIAQQRLAHKGQPLEVLRQITQQYKLAEIPQMPRFAGGMVGYMTYEMSHFFESKVKNLLPPEKPLADFIIPEVLLIFDNVDNTLSVLSLAFTQGQNDLSKLHAQSLKRLNQVLRTLQSPAPALSDVPSEKDLHPQPTQAPADFEASVEKIKAYIAQGEVVQTVLSQNFVCEVPENLLGLYRAQRHLNPSPYMYFMRNGGVDLIGSSPETMIRLEQKRACLRPIAGTRVRGATPQEDLALADELLKDEKERAEHLMLVDLGRNELGRVALTGTVQVKDLMIVERYSHVMHLVSEIAAEMDDEYDAFDLLQSAFPAGTLSGAPKVRAMEIISELENEPRGAYGGAVGYVSFDGNMDFAICIRTAVIEDGRLSLRAGAGVVADSVPATERQETINKARAVARALELLQSPLQSTLQSSLNQQGLL